MSITYNVLITLYLGECVWVSSVLKEFFRYINMVKHNRDVECCVALKEKVFWVQSDQITAICSLDMGHQGGSSSHQLHWTVLVWPHSSSLFCKHSTALNIMYREKQFIHLYSFVPHWSAYTHRSVMLLILITLL